MTIYLAGPMTGVPERNYPAFDKATILLQDRGFAILNPASIDTDMQLDTRMTWDWYMRHAIRMVLTADAIALLPGWENSKGACLEREIGQALELDIRLLEDWLLA
jgi:Domain of unknown function (DUF4406)